MGWVEVCKLLEGAANVILGAADWSFVRHHMGQQQPTSSQAPDSLQLVSTKVLALCRRLVACKVPPLQPFKAAETPEALSLHKSSRPVEQICCSAMPQQNRPFIWLLP